MSRTKKIKGIIDDGCSPELITGANWAGELELPCLSPPEKIIIPSRLVPFSKRTQASDNDAICFYEPDENFSDVLRTPIKFIDDFSKSVAVLSPDCSQYQKAPLSVQIANNYRNRAIGYYYQQMGINVIPHVRWGDERTYSTVLFNEKIAFLGIPKHSIVAIGTYGCCKEHVEKYHFKAGLDSMLDELSPEVVLVYGSMGDLIFGNVKNRAYFVHYPDWISLKKGGA